jgi:hypothetical protein
MCFDSGTVLLTVRASDCSLRSHCWCCAGSLLAAGLGDKQVALVVEVGVVSKMLEIGLPKHQKLQDGYPHTLECMVSGTKQYA